MYTILLQPKVIPKNVKVPLASSLFIIYVFFRKLEIWFCQRRTRDFLPKASGNPLKIYIDTEIANNNAEVASNFHSLVIDSVSAAN